MDRINHPTATAERTFTGGNPAANIPATVVTPEYMTMLQEEVCNVILSGGLELDPEDDTQLAQAVAAMIAAQAVTVGPASTTEAGIVELATDADAAAGTDAERAVTPHALAAALLAGLAGVARLGAVGAYTRQQYNAPVERAGVSGSQAVDMDLHQLLSITATAAIAMAAPTNLAVGKTCTIMVYAASAYTITWDAAYLPNEDATLPTTTKAGKWIIMNFLCHKAGSLLLTGTAKEA